MAMARGGLLAHYLQAVDPGAESGDDARPGLGIDYALLMVSRFREALAEGYAPARLPILLPGKRDGR